MTVHFAGYGKSYDFMEQHKCSNLHHTPREVCLEGEDGFFSLKKTLLCSKWIMLDMALSAMSVSRLISRQRFDCIVCDTMYGGVVAARVHRVPVVFITNQNHFNGPGSTTNPVWFILNFLIRRYLRLANHIIVPDYPAPDTVSEYNVVVPKGEERDYHFTGSVPGHRSQPIHLCSQHNIHQFWRGAVQTPALPDAAGYRRPAQGPVL